MTWLQPAAWVGLVALALPILIHLLARGEARRLKFPTLRFVEASPLMASRRTRLDDLLLLALRTAILAAAVGALAQPLWRTSGQRALLDRALLRAIVVDTSSSMRRALADGRPALAVARDSATTLAGAADAAITVETASLRAGVADAASWLAEQAGRGEVVVLSDFQHGALDSAALAQLPTAIGLRLVWISAPPATTALLNAREGDLALQVEASTAGAETEGRWSRTTADTAAATVVTPLGARATQAHRAVIEAGVPVAGTPPRDVVVLHGPSPDGDRIRANAAPLGQGWMLVLVDELRAAALPAEGPLGTPAAMTLDSAVWSPVVRASDGALLAAAASDGTTGHDRLVIAVADSASALLTAALMAEVVARTNDAEAMREAEPRQWDDQVLARWQREPRAERRAVRADPDVGPSDGRWLWLVALLLLALEAWLRRTPRGTDA